MNEEQKNRAMAQARTGIGDALTNMDLLRPALERDEFPEDPAFIKGLRYASLVLLQAAECLEGKRDYVNPDEVKGLIQTCNEMIGQMWNVALDGQTHLIKVQIRNVIDDLLKLKEMAEEEEMAKVTIS